MREVRNGLMKFSPPTKQRQRIGEMVRFMSRYADSPKITDRDRHYVSSWVNQGRHSLERASNITDCLCFRNFVDNMQKNEHQAFNRSMGIAVPLQAISHSNNGLPSSYWRETEISLSKFVRQANRIFNSFPDEYGMQTWFVLLNLIEALSDPSAPDLLSDYQRLVSKHESHFLDCTDISPGLRVYAYDLNDQGLISIAVPEISSSQRSGFEPRTLVYDILGRLRREESTTLSELTDAVPAQNAHLWAVARAWNRTYHDEPSGVLPYSHGVDLDYLFDKLFAPEETDLTTVTLNPEDLRKVRKMDDEQIQSALVSLFESNRFLTKTSRVSLSQEQTKAHAGGEISDFDVEVKIADDKSTYYVSFPIKSSAEAGNQTVEQLAESNLHQLLRPTIQFRDCAVFPILVAGTSLNLQEVLKSHRSQFNLPIKFIDEELFGKILKENSLT